MVMIIDIMVFCCLLCDLTIIFDWAIQVQFMHVERVGEKGRKFLDNPQCHLTTHTVCVCVCVCV